MAAPKCGHYFFNLREVDVPLQGAALVAIRRITDNTMRMRTATRAVPAYG